MSCFLWSTLNDWQALDFLALLYYLYYRDDEAPSGKSAKMGEFFVHSDVLKVASPYFKTMFGSSLTEASSKVIKLRQSSPVYEFALALVKEWANNGLS